MCDIVQDDIADWCDVAAVFTLASVYMFLPLLIYLSIYLIGISQGN